MPHPYLASYGGSKHALEGFFGGLRQEYELSNKNISFTMCILGLIGNHYLYINQWA